MNKKETVTLDLKKITDKLPRLNSSSDYWLVRTNSGKYFQDFRSNGYIGIGMNKVTLEDIEEGENLIEKLKQIIVKRYPAILSTSDQVEPDNSTEFQPEMDLSQDGSTETEPTGSYTPRQLSSIASQLLKFGNDIQINDIVVCPSQSSDFYLVGKVSGKPYFEKHPNKDDATNEAVEYRYSGYTKRIPVNWISTFSKDDADAKLLKLSYLRHTINDINEYSDLINRAIFDAYVLDGDELHLTFKVEQEEQIQSRFLGGFLYNFGEAYYALSKDELISQINVQSKGPIHLIFKVLGAGMAVSAFIAITLTGGNFNIKIAGFGPSGSTPGIITTIDQHQKAVTDIQIKKEEAAQRLQTEKNKEKERMRRELMKEAQSAYDFSLRTGIPISKLNIKLPQQIEDEIQKQVDEQRSSKSNLGNLNSNKVENNPKNDSKQN